MTTGGIATFSLNPLNFIEIIAAIMTMNPVPMAIKSALAWSIGKSLQ